eukprot:COSAG04_NODE_4166_length_2260_cov_1.220268_2_plen_377_part_00
MSPTSGRSTSRRIDVQAEFFSPKNTPKLVRISGERKLRAKVRGLQTMGILSKLKPGGLPAQLPEPEPEPEPQHVSRLTLRSPESPLRSPQSPGPQSPHSPHSPTFSDESDGDDEDIEPVDDALLAKLLESCPGASRKAARRALSETHGHVGIARTRLRNAEQDDPGRKHLARYLAEKRTSSKSGLPPLSAAAAVKVLRATKVDNLEERVEKAPWWWASSFGPAPDEKGCHDMVRAKLRHQFQPQADDEPGNALANRIYLNRLRERASDRTSFHNKLQTRRRWAKASDVTWAKSELQPIVRAQSWDSGGRASENMPLHRSRQRRRGGIMGAAPTSKRFSRWWRMTIATRRARWFGAQASRRRKKSDRTNEVRLFISS